MRIYELIFILRPDLPEEEIEQVIEHIKTTITSGEGSIDKIEHSGQWGKRKLAYKVQRYAEGYYVLIQYSLEKDTGLSKEVERRLRVTDPVIKFMTVRIDEDLKRIEKLKTKREKRTARKPPARSAASPSPGRPSSAPEAPAKPAAPAE